MWDDKLDAKLMKFKREGLSFAQIAERIGVSRDAAIGRFHRLEGTRFPSEVRRKSELEQARLERAASLAGHRDGVVSVMKGDLKRGMSRDEAIAKALEYGATLQTIADALGLSRQRIHQIANAA